ncbi:MAG: hypothetical protein OEM93_20630 [Rhodospirillales bacterium]|nr:hypothetical protein [Rhodospirillales bacterium]MDH3791664.1 hypothetical protein [Rhodospirillales bacterium]MDH3969868.1 hypothetical protein [Rhodospirillales bacterium]
MTWLGAIGRLVGAFAKLAGVVAPYLLGRKSAEKRSAKRAAKHAREANRIDENVKRLSDADLHDELHRK